MAVVFINAGKAIGPGVAGVAGEVVGEKVGFADGEVDGRDGGEWGLRGAQGTLPSGRIVCRGNGGRRRWSGGRGRRGG